MYIIIVIYISVNFKQLTMNNLLKSTDLKIGEIYHIKDNKANHINKVWFNKYTLVDKEKYYGGEVIVLVFRKQDNEIAIDMDFVSTESGQNYNVISYK